MGKYEFSKVERGESMEDRLLSKMFEYDRWVGLLDKADEKGINKTVLRKISSPQVRLELYNRIKNGQYEIAPPHAINIPKDNGDFRTVYANEDIDRIVLTLINDCAMEIFKNHIHSSCVSYQKGIGCQEIVSNIPKAMKKLYKNDGKPVAVVSDYSKFFDRICIEAIDNCFDTMEKELGFIPNTEPVICILRKYYHSNLFFDIDGNLVEEYKAIKQGSATAAILSCMILYDLDEYMSNKYPLYLRYSDDSLTCADNIDEAVDDINRLASQYGIGLNPSKIKPVYVDKYFKFLGFNICGDVITLSKNRVKKLTKEIAKATLEKPNITPNQAKENIKRLLYGNGDGYSWATSCFSAMQNCDKDIEVLNSYIMDCIRLCEVRYNYNKERKAKGLKPRQIRYNMADVGGIGVVLDQKDHTLIRGKGKKVKTARQRTQKEIDHYKSVGCLLKCYKLGKPIYEATVRSI